MKINEVEQAIGIPKKNIRYYEEEGLLTPPRKENGYREYGEAEIETLKKIKLLRKLSLPIEEIRMIQEKKLSLEDALKRHLITLEREEKNLREISDMCRALSMEEIYYETLDASLYLEKILDMEEKGVRFMNVGDLDKKKKRSSIIAALIFVGWMVLLEGFMIYPAVTGAVDLPSIAFLIVVFSLPLIGIGCIVAVLRERIKEIEGGEENEASKY